MIPVSLELLKIYFMFIGVCGVNVSDEKLLLGYIYNLCVCTHTHKSWSGSLVSNLSSALREN